MSLRKMAESLDDKNFRSLMDETMAVTDDLGRKLLQKLASLNSPIKLTDLPIGAGTRDQELARLYHLESLGWVTSKLVNKDDATIREFHINEKIRGRVAAIG